MQREGKKCVEDAAKFENSGSRGLKRRWDLSLTHPSREWTEDACSAVETTISALRLRGMDCRVSVYEDCPAIIYIAMCKYLFWIERASRSGVTGEP